MYRNDYADNLYDYLSYEDAPPCVNFTQYVTTYFLTWRFLGSLNLPFIKSNIISLNRSLLTDDFIQNIFNPTSIIYTTKEEPVLPFIKKGNLYS